MAYTVKKLAQISGVSVRTLHFYDEIGLLKPAYYGENKYRYYEEEQLLLLQQILFFRELKFNLNDIQRIMGSDDFDKIDTLLAHKKILKDDLSRIQSMLRTIDKTVSHLWGKTKMSEQEIFDGVRPHDDKKQKDYETYLLDKKIMTQKDLEQSWKRVENWQKEDWEKFHKSGDELNQSLAVAVEKNLAPESAEVQKLIRRHYEMVNYFWTPNKETYIGLGNLYREHPDFQKYYAKFHPQLVEFLIKAMKIFAERNL